MSSPRTITRMPEMIGEVLLGPQISPEAVSAFALRLRAAVQDRTQSRGLAIAGNPAAVIEQIRKLVTGAA